MYVCVCLVRNLLVVVAASGSGFGLAWLVHSGMGHETIEVNEYPHPFSPTTGHKVAKEEKVSRRHETENIEFLLTVADSDDNVVVTLRTQWRCYLETFMIVVVSTRHDHGTNGYGQITLFGGDWEWREEQRSCREDAFSHGASRTRHDLTEWHRRSCAHSRIALPRYPVCG